MAEDLQEISGLVEDLGVEDLVVFAVWQRPVVFWTRRSPVATRFNALPVWEQNRQLESIAAGGSCGECFVGAVIGPVLLERIRTAATAAGAAEDLDRPLLVNADFSGAHFTGDADFERFEFRGDLRAAPIEAPGEDQPVVIEGDANLFEAKIEGNANLYGATIEGNTNLGGATLGGDANLVGAEIGGDASLVEAKIGGDADLFGATIEGNAYLYGATIEGITNLGEAKIEGNTNLVGSMIGGDASLVEAKIEGNADLSRSKIEGNADLSRSKIEGDVDLRAATMAGKVMLVETRVEGGVTFGGGASYGVDATGLRVEGGQIVLAGGDLDLSGATVVRPLEITTTDDGPESGTPPKLVSVERIDLSAPVTIASGIDVRDCRFGRTPNLDQLRFAGTNQFDTHRGRQVIKAEHDFVVEGAGEARGVAWVRRELRTRCLAPGGGDAGEARRIAEVYRQLRTSMEATRDYPGASDFYYGEMEMRRSATWHTKGVRAAADWLIIWIYWLISGYGLRASRAFATFAVVVALATVLFQFNDFSPGKAELGYLDTVVYALKSSISLLRAPDAGEFTFGENLVQITLRILAPALFALGVFALRDRIRR